MIKTCTGQNLPVFLCSTYNIEPVHGYAAELQACCTCLLHRCMSATQAVTPSPCSLNVALSPVKSPEAPHLQAGSPRASATGENSMLAHAC